MKLVRYGDLCHEKPGILDDNGQIRDLSSIVPDINGMSLFTRLDDIKAADINALPLVEGNPRLGACVGDIGKFMCIGLNYSDHAAETGAAIPEHPILL